MKRTTIQFLCLFFSSLIVLLGAAFIHSGFGVQPEASSEWVKVSVIDPILSILTSPIQKPIFFILVPAIFFLEYVIPADTTQKMFGRSVGQDIIWFLIVSVFDATVMVAYVAILASLYHSYFSFLTITSLGELPLFIRFLWGILLADFISWGNHWLRHKIPWYWKFHMLHHSQRRLSMFTDSRYHVVEYFIGRTIDTVPLLMLSVNTPTIIFYKVFKKWLNRFHHANVKVDLGPLRYIFVSPQFHRLHHSSQKEHYDRNLGSVFIFWDWLFNTYCGDKYEYPKVGFDDTSFPNEQNEKGVFGFFKTTARQFIFPFQAIALQSRPHPKTINTAL